MVDATGREIPYADRDGHLLPDVRSRFFPAEGQHFFLKGGNIEQAKYRFDGPETLPYEQLKKMGYRLPFYADLTSLPELERKAIWGLMVGQEGKTNVPIYRNYTDAGFDPAKHVLQCYGVGWMSAEFLPNERQFFGLSGGFMNDWKLQTSLPGLFAGGDALFASNCYGHAAATGYYAGRHAADYTAAKTEISPISQSQVDAEIQRVYAPLARDFHSGINWKELNQAISKTMQNTCGEVRCDELLATRRRRAGALPAGGPPPDRGG